MIKHTPMTDVELSIVAKMQRSVTFLPGHAHKRFVRNLTPDSKLSAKGRNYLAFIAHRYRRQWTASCEEFHWIVEHMAYGLPAIPPAPRLDGPEQLALI